MRKYDHLFFDLDNTLWDFSANSRIAMQITLDQAGILRHLNSFDDFFAVYEEINHSLWRDYHSKKITKQILTVERFSKSLKAFGLIDFDYQELNQKYLDVMGLQTGIFPETIETLAVLKSKGYKMFIITNGFREVQKAKLKNCNLTTFFTKVFISEDIQTTKPHRQIFEYALKSSNAQKKRSIMIGDSWETDISGAMNFGMDQVMVLNHGQNKVPDEINLQRKGLSSEFLELKHRTKTCFLQEISQLVKIL
jgi:putative hydrolase of the HAD superfamily